jgi:microcystin-dependent protein
MNKFIEDFYIIILVILVILVINLYLRKDKNEYMTRDAINNLPSGTIVAYNKTSAPSEWTLCDGSSGSPDLRNRFILGWGNRGVGATGGEENVTLNEGQMPYHAHSVTSRGDINLYNYSSYMLHYTNQNYNVPTIDRGRSPAKFGEISVYGDTNAKGGNQAHNNMPPFYVLTYIMKL